MSHVMQVLERLVLGWLSLHDLESLQFAYHPLVGVNDAVIYLLQNTHSHLNSEKMSEKKLRMDFTTSNFFLDCCIYKSDRPQLVQLGAPCLTWWLVMLAHHRGQSYLHSCLLMWIADFQYRSKTCHLQKFFDTSLIGCIKGGVELEYRVR